MLPTLDLEALEALGEDLFDSTDLAANHEGVRRSIRTRRLARAGTVGAAGFAVALGAATLALRTWETPEPAQPPPDGWPVDAFPVSALIGAAVPWEEGLDGQAFIQTSVVPIELNPSPHPNPDYRGTVSVPTAGGFTYEQQVASGLDVVSATASLTGIGASGQAEYEFTMTNVTDRPLVLDKDSITLVIELPDNLKQWSYTMVSSTLSGDQTGHSIALLPRGSLDGRGSLIGRNTDERDLFLPPGESLAINGRLHPIGSFPNFSDAAPLGWSDLLDQYGDEVVLSVCVRLRGPTEGILDDLILVERAVGRPTTE